MKKGKEDEWGIKNMLRQRREAEGGEGNKTRWVRRGNEEDEGRSGEYKEREEENNERGRRKKDEIRGRREERRREEDQTIRPCPPVPPQSAVFRRQQDESVQHRHILLSTDYWNLQSTDTDSNHKTKVTAPTAGPGIDLNIPVILDEGSR